MVASAKIPKENHVTTFIPLSLPKKYATGENIKGKNVAAIR
jgi:hypothetical protein